MLKCGITGHSGTLGSQLIKKKFNFKFIVFKDDICRKKKIYQWIKKNKLDLILHFAAIVPIRDVENNFSYANSVNYIGTKNLVDAIVENNLNLKWFFFSSTSHVYRLPKKKIKINETCKKKAISKYGLTKLKAERYIKKKLSKSKIPYCIGRIFSFTHINQEDSYLIPSIVKKIRKSKKNNIVFNNMNHYRDFVSVADICEAIKLLWIKKSKGEFNIASGKATYIKNIVKFLCKKYKKKPIFIDNGKSYLVGDVKKIKKLGWKSRKNIFQILNEYLAIRGIF
jgi:nucleoside-diphosphate-sugar epimerase